MRLLKLFGLVLVLFVSFSSWGLAAGDEQPVFDPGTPPCQKTECQTTCTGPLHVECCCLYVCNTGGSTWVCQEGMYCDNTDRSCIF
jgi:hypothetical protein